MAHDKRLARLSYCNIGRRAYNSSSISCKLKSFHAGYEQFEIAQDRRHLVAGIRRGLPAAQAHRSIATLGMTQSAVSHALGRLREIFEDELFLRRPFGVE